MQRVGLHAAAGLGIFLALWIILSGAGIQAAASFVIAAFVGWYAWALLRQEK